MELVISNNYPLPRANKWLPDRHRHDSRNLDRAAMLAALVQLLAVDAKFPKGCHPPARCRRREMKSPWGLEGAAISVLTQPPRHLRTKTRPAVDAHRQATSWHANLNSPNNEPHRLHGKPAGPCWTAKQSRSRPPVGHHE